jgi:hypothetical protein
MWIVEVQACQMAQICGLEVVPKTESTMDGKLVFFPQSRVVPRNQRQINKYYLGQVNYWATAFYCRFFVFLYLVFLRWHFLLLLFISAASQIYETPESAVLVSN